MPSTVLEDRAQEFDPDAYRMSIGDHLEELRRRLVWGLLGMLAASVVCLIWGEYALDIFCRPLEAALQKYDLNPQIYMHEVTDSFVTYIKVSLICAGVIASPWMVYQLWQFVRAGLYPRERRYVTRYIPLSIALLIAGMLFLYYFVLPITLNFLIAFTINIPMTGGRAPVVADVPASQVVTVPVLAGDPAHPAPYQLWVDSTQGRLKIFFRGQVRVIQLGPQNLVAPMITLPDYIDLVLKLLLLFGLSFQLPLVMLALVRIGILDVATLRRSRRMAYFIITVLAAFVVPDVVTGMLAMMGPMVVLYELGILLAARGERATPDAET